MFRKLFLSIFSLFFVIPMNVYSMETKDQIQENANGISEQDLIDYMREQELIELMVAYIANKDVSVAAIKNFIETNNVNIEGLTSKQLTPLGVVAKTITGNRGCEFVSYFLSKGADINRRTGPNQKLPIELALKAGNVQVARCLINSGAYIDEKILSIKDDDDYTILHYALDSLDSLDFIAYLINRGADIQMPYPDGTSILEQVAVLTGDYLDSGNGDPLSLLLDYGLNPNKADEKGITMLHALARLDWQFLFQELSNIDLENGVSQMRVINTLVAHGAELEARNTKGETPLMYAVRKGRFDVAYALILHGACTKWDGDEAGERVKSAMKSRLQGLDALRLARQQADRDLSNEKQCEYEILSILNWLLNNAESIRKQYSLAGSGSLREEVIQELAKNKKNIRAHVLKREITGTPIQGKKRPYMSIKKQNKREKKRRRIINYQS